MSLTCQALLKKHPEAWENATRHPFLEQCQSGEIKPNQFNTWLVQDYLFVTEFTRMAARTLSVAPVAHFDVILGGLAALQDELNWFREKAQERNLNLGAARQETCEQYCKFMEDLGLEPYEVQAVGFWAIELAYNQAWQEHSPMTPPYDEFANRWGNPEFTEYVKLLEQQADAVLHEARPQIHERSEEVFLRVAELEKDFWQMAFAGEK